jgi:choline dehydrogenase-like flavoprotein
MSTCPGGTVSRVDSRLERANNRRWSQNFDGPNDWNLETEPMAALDGRTVKATRGRFLGGSSGVNGTLCIRGTKQDYDDWEMEGWSGEEMWKYMAKASTGSRCGAGLGSLRDVY